MSDDIIIELEHPERPRRPGEVLRGRVHVRPGAGASCRGLHVRRCWKTHGRGNRDVGSAAELTLLDGPIAAAERAFPFEFEVPPGSPTYRGRLLNVDHYVEAWLDLPMALDAKTEVEFVVVPGDDPPPPPQGLLERSRKAGGSGVGGCGLPIGIVMAFVGVLMLPVGLILIAVAVFLIVPPVRKAVAEKKLGRISAALRPERVAPGGDVDVEVAIHPDRGLSVNEVGATLRCREICVSGRGTDRTTHREEVATIPLVLEGPTSLRKGEPVAYTGTVRVPDDAAYTFAASNNNVVWDVELHVDIPSWPDWQERLPLVVWPAGEPALEPADASQAVEPAEPVQAVEPAEPVQGPPAAPPDPVAPVDPPPRPSPDAPPSPSPAVSVPREPPPLPPDAPELARRLRAILAEPRFGGRRDDLIDELIGGEYAFTLVIDRNERSFGVPAGYRDGRTLQGTLDDTELGVAVRFPPERNEELAGLGRGDRVSVEARAIQWESLGSQPLMEA